MDSDTSEYEDALMTSVGSSLNVPRQFQEKRGLTKTSSYPLERVQKSTQQQKDSEAVLEKLADKYSGPKDIYDWWLNEVDQEK